MENTRSQHYAGRFRQIYDGSPWYGDNFVSKIADITSENAFVSPVTGLHAVAQVVAHMTYWRQALISRLRNSGKPFKPSMKSDDNWPSISHLQQTGWEKTRSAFDESQAEIIKLLSGQTDSFLAVEYDKGYSIDDLVQGIIDHDIYHIGQIGLIKKLVVEAKE